jgi:hypothetical protein
MAENTFERAAPPRVLRKNNSWRRFLILYLPWLFGSDIHDRELAKLWTEISRFLPVWYRPVNDLLTPEFGQLLERLAENCRVLALAVHLKDVEVLPTTYLISVRNRLLEAFLRRNNLSGEQIVASESGDLEARTQMGNKLKALSRIELQEWDRGFVGLAALLQLTCYPWHQLGQLFPSKESKLDPRGMAHVDHLMDLYFLAASVRLNPLVEILLGEAFSTSGQAPLVAIKACLGELQHDDRLKTLIFGILGDTKFRLPQSGYRPPLLAAELETRTHEFQIACRRKEKLELAEEITLQVSLVFGKKPLAEVAMYNAKTNATLAGKKLPGLIHCEALQILATFRQVHDRKLIQQLFQDFQLEVEFLNDVKRQRFQDTLDQYYQFIRVLNKLEEDFASASQSPLAPIRALLENRPAEKGPKDGPHRAITVSNEIVASVCRKGLWALQALHRLLSAYQVDSESRTPENYAAGPALRQKLPSLFSRLDQCVKVLGDVFGVLTQVIDDQPEGKSPSNQKLS